MAWGDFWVERSGANCDCLIRSRKFSCIKTGGFRTQDASPTTVATVSGDCSTACEDLSGYSAGISTMLAKYAPGTGNYECDTAFVDGDGDGFGSCIDENDTNPRVFVKINATRPAATASTTTAMAPSTMASPPAPSTESAWPLAPTCRATARTR
jgi:hypothetical protein